jgi:hypothetical protein
MKRFNILPILLMLAQAISAQEICGSRISGAKTEAEAEQKAAASLALAINSKVSYASKTEETIDGTESRQRDTTKASISSKLLNAHAAKYAKGRDAEGYFSKACMNVKDAATPYLNSLKDLARTLKTQTQKADRNSCKSINETYKSIEGVESVLNNLAQMNNEVQAEYETLKEEYQSDGKGGVFLEIRENIFGEKSDAISGKLREVLSASNCRVERNICKASGGFTLRINATACNHKYDGAFDHCSSCLKIDLLNGRNEIVISPSVKTAAAWEGKAAACEKAFELSAPEIFSKIKDKISEVCE